MVKRPIYLRPATVHRKGFLRSESGRGLEQGALGNLAEVGVAPECDDEFSGQSDDLPLQVPPVFLLRRGHMDHAPEILLAGPVPQQCDAVGVLRVAWT